MGFDWHSDTISRQTPVTRTDCNRRAAGMRPGPARFGTFWR